MPIRTAGCFSVFATSSARLRYFQSAYLFLFVTYSIQYVCKEWLTLVWAACENWPMPALPPLHRMPNLKSLYIYIPDARIISGYMVDGKLEKRWYSASGLAAAIASMEHLVELTLVTITGPLLMIKAMESLVQSPFLQKNLQRLYLRWSEPWAAFPSEKDAYELLSMICDNLPQLKQLELPGGAFFSARDTPQSTVDACLDNICQLHNLEYLLLPPMGPSHNWSQLRSLKKMKSISLSTRIGYTVGEEDINRIIRDGLAFVDLRCGSWDSAFGGAWLAQIVQWGTDPELCFAIVALLKEYESNGIFESIHDLEAILENMLSFSNCTTEIVEVLTHPVVLSKILTQGEFFHSPSNWFAVLGMISRVGNEQSMIRALEKLVDHFFPGREPLAALNCRLCKILEGLLSQCLETLITVDSDPDLSLTVETCKDLCLARFPGALAEITPLFSQVLLYNAEIGLKIYTDASAERRHELLIGDKYFGVLSHAKHYDYAELSNEKGSLRQIYIAAIELINTDQVDISSSRTSPMASAIQYADVKWIKFLIAHGYKLRPRLDLSPDICEGLLLRCTNVSDLEYIVSLFDPKEIGRVIIPFDRPARPDIIAAAREFGFDILEELPLHE
jgi:hypothetical protein